MTTLLLFSSINETNRAIETLKTNGISNDRMSVITLEESYKQLPRDVQTSNQSDTGKDVSAGIVTGGLTGGLVGLLGAAAAIALPGIGPVVLAGPLVAALGYTGASTAVGSAIGAAVGGIGGLAASLSKAGADEETAQNMEDVVKSGGAIVALEDISREEAQSMLGAVTPRDIVQLA